MLYVTKKEEACLRIGVNCRIIRLPESVSQSQLQQAVADVAADAAVDGVLVQLPLPRHLDEEAVMGALDPRKDVDGFHPLNMGRMLMRGRARRFVPATPLGVVELLSRSGVSLAGKTAVVLGDSNIVGTPLAALLRDEGAALVTICHRPSIHDWFEERSACRSQRAQADVCLPRLPGPGPGPAAASAAAAGSAGASTPSSSTQQGAVPGSGSEGGGFQASQLPAICRTADVLVVAVGSPELVRGAWVKPGAVVVDVGINVVAAEEEPAAAAAAAAAAAGGGDVSHDEVAGVASVLTPVPGGVGPMTIAAVLHNTLQAARYKAGLLRW
ncbi:hypothetical protein OEZ86_005956 [Tetradesmus obliquus]|nr:hypothetical protein OEZ86_005956 [Tetradesmus obliquus]